MNDTRIIELYYERSEQAISETASKYGRLCQGVAYRILGCAEDAEECVNDTYLNMWNSIPPKRPDNLRAFICKVTRNLSLSRLKRRTAKKRTPESIVSLSELGENVSDGRLPFDDERDEGEIIGKAISDFLRTESAEARNVFMRKYWFLESIDDISERYSFSQSKVKSMLFRTRERLRKYLEKEGIYL